MMYILKFKLFGLDIWKDCTHLIFIFPTLLIVEKGMYMVLCDVDIYILTVNGIVIITVITIVIYICHIYRRVNCHLICH